jgi:ABC-type transport system involved in multi-copper enzyme maturation permease subunit
METLRDLLGWLWHLVPGNPILVRIVATGGKRTQHLTARLVYLALLFIALVWSQSGLVSSSQGGSLADLAKQSSQTFFWVSLVQLSLMSLIAPIFCAGAITQERDTNTFQILLTTPLSNAQIVLGSLLGRMFFVWALLVAGLPIFCITMIYGGVTAREVFESFGLAATTGLLTGSIAVMIGLLRLGTRRTILAFFTGVAAYLLGVGWLGLSDFARLEQAPRGPLDWQMSWLAPFHPFLSLFVVTGLTPTPGAEELARLSQPWRQLLAHPAYSYMLLTTLASLLMVAISVGFVRAETRQGERSLRDILRQIFAPPHDQLRRRRPRHVWQNPIAWREAATRAAAGARSVLRWFFLLAGTTAGVILLVAHYSSWSPLSSANPTATRSWLTALLWTELAVILLVVTNTAASTLTREKESKTIELLLCTPLTSRYIIAGMLRGLVSFALPLIAVPSSTILLFVLADLTSLGRNPQVLPPESVLLTPLLMFAYAALAAVVGLWYSLTSRTTVQAMMVSTAVIAGASALLTGCGAAFAKAGPTTAAIVLPFTTFPAVRALVDYPAALDPTGAAIAPGEIFPRVLWGLFCLVASPTYLGFTYAIYRTIVREFDVILRRQMA